MKKSNKSWIIAGLLTLATLLATIYSIVAYHDSVMIVGITCLLFLGSAFWLFLCINNMLEGRSSQDKSVGEEQRDRMNYEGMKLQGEEMLRLVNSLGKGTYISTKRSAEHLDALLKQYEESRKTTEFLLKTLVDEQAKTTKMQIKYNQNDTGKMIAALNEQCARLDTDFDRVITAIQVQAANAPASQNNDIVSESLRTLTVELAHINSSIQALQIQLNSMPQQPAYAYAPPMPQMMAPQPVVEPAPIVQGAPAPEPTPIVEETPAPEPTPIVEETPAPEPAPIVEETLAPEPTLIVEVAPAPEPTPIVEETPAPEPTPIVEEAPAPEPTPAPAPAGDMGKMDQSMIDALLAGAMPAASDTPAPEPTPIVEETPAPEPTPAPAPAGDMGKMDQNMIDALLAGAMPAASEAPAPELAPIVEETPAPEPAPAGESFMMDQAMIDALMAGETVTPPAPEPEPEPEPVVENTLVSGDPNKQLSPDEIAALFAAMG